MKKKSLIAGALSAFVAFNVSAGSDSFLNDASKKFQIKAQTEFGLKCLTAEQSGGVLTPLLRSCSDSDSGQKWNYTEHGQIITDVGTHSYLCLTGRPSDTPVLKHCNTKDSAQSWNTIRRTITLGGDKTTYVHLQNNHGDLEANGTHPTQSKTASYLRLANPADFDNNLVPIYAQFSIVIGYNGKSMHIFNSQDVGVGSRPTLTNYYNLHNNYLFTARNDTISQDALCYTSPLPDSSWNWATYESCSTKGMLHDKYRWQFSIYSSHSGSIADIKGNLLYNNNAATANRDYMFVGTGLFRQGVDAYISSDTDNDTAYIDPYAAAIVDIGINIAGDMAQIEQASTTAISRIPSCPTSN